MKRALEGVVADPKVINIDIYLDTLLNMTNFGNGNQFKFHKAIVRVQDQEFMLHQMHIKKTKTIFPFKDHDTVLTLIKSHSGTEEKISVNLHPVIVNRLQRFLIEGEPSVNYPTYSCSDFMNELLLGRESMPLNQYKNHNFFTKVSPPNYFANDGVMLVRNDGGVVHCAVYIGHDLLLYKFGMNGPLLVTTLPEMIKAYTDDHHGPLRTVRAMPSNGILTAYYNAMKLENLAPKTLSKIGSYLCLHDKINLANTNKLFVSKMASLCPQ